MPALLPKNYFASLVVCAILTLLGNLDSRQSLLTAAAARILDDIVHFQPLIADRHERSQAYELLKRIPQGGTKTVPYADTLDPKNKSALKEFCNITATTEHRDQVQLLFTNPKLDTLSNDEVSDTLANECFRYQDQAMPQYSKANTTYYDKDKKEAKIQGTFTGGRVPGQKGVYAASCEIQKITDPKWYDSEPDSVRAKQQVNVNGQSGPFTDKFISNIGAQKYNGKGEFCQGATNA